jgi:autophagy-related protein 11
MGGNTSTAEGSDNGSHRSIDDENPFELSDGLRWYMIDAQEEKLGAPGTPSVGKSTVTASNVEVKGHMGRKEQPRGLTSSSNTNALVTKTLTKSLDSRRSSSGSKQSIDLKAKRDGSGLKDMAAPLAPITSDTDAEGDIGRPSNSKDSLAAAGMTISNSASAGGVAGVVRQPSETGQTDREEAQVFEVVRRDLLLGP